MNERLRLLIEGARGIRPTPEEREEQRRSFAFGNTALANPHITRELINRVADKHKPRQ